jgi:hypothetical protein
MSWLTERARLFDRREVVPFEDPRRRPVAFKTPQLLAHSALEREVALPQPERHGHFALFERKPNGAAVDAFRESSCRQRFGDDDIETSCRQAFPSFRISLAKIVMFAPRSRSQRLRERRSRPVSPEKKPTFASRSSERPESRATAAQPVAACGLRDDEETSCRLRVDDAAGQHQALRARDAPVARVEVAADRRVGHEHEANAEALGDRFEELDVDARPRRITP